MKTSTICYTGNNHSYSGWLFLTKGTFTNLPTQQKVNTSIVFLKNTMLYWFNEVCMISYFPAGSYKLWRPPCRILTGENCQRIANGLPTDCQRIANGLPTDCQRIANGSPTDRQRIASCPHYILPFMQRGS